MMDWADRVGRRIKLRDLHILLTVARTGTMGKAASELAVSQPVISKTIADLEHAIGQSLFDRSPQGVEPTPFGRALIKCGVTVFDELRHGVRELQFLSDPTAGELRIGCTEAGATGFVPAVIERLSRQYPRITFHVVTADPATLTGRDLPDRNVEVAIGATPTLPKDTVIETESLFNERQVVMAGAKSKWARARKISLADLIDEPWVLPPPDSIAAFHIAEAFRANGLTPPVAQVQTFSMPLTHHLLASGRFLSMQAVEMARLAAHLPLRVLDVRFEGLARQIALMTVKNRAISPLAKLFMDCAREMARGLRRG
jgi:DNA-binding transcriptional LysR family regulator